MLSILKTNLFNIFFLFFWYSNVYIKDAIKDTQIHKDKTKTSKQNTKDK